MFKNLLHTIFCVFFLTFFISCQKDLVDGSIGNGGSASFVLEGAPGGCTSATVTGTYEKSTPLSTSNTVTITVNVQAKGTYAIRTNSANGVYFTGSGTFGSTGTQTVTLTGVGTPANTGNYTYATTNKSACTFNIAVVANSGGGGGGGGSTTAVFTYAGAPGNCTGATPAGMYMNGIAMNASNTVDLSVNVTTIGTYNITTTPSKGISFAGAGSFASLGVQTVRLTAQGTPNAQGAATFTPSGGCSFSVTIAAAPAAGVFTYNCTLPPQVLGTYNAGTALNNTNTIIIAVNVTTVGSYSVSTNGFNGVTFRGSGVFTTTGAANFITLTSTDVPMNAGPFVYTPGGAGGCPFTVTYGGGGGGGTTDFIKCTIDGVFINFNVGVTGSLVPGTFSATADDATNLKTFDLNVTDLSGGTITTGTYNKLSPTNSDKYCDPIYTPDNSNPLSFWSTDIANPNVFTITIQSITANRITGIFSGDLFDDFGANKKIISAGSFSVPY